MIISNFTNKKLIINYFEKGKRMKFSYNIFTNKKSFFFYLLFFFFVFLGLSSSLQAQTNIYQYDFNSSNGGWSAPTAGTTNSNWQYTSDFSNYPYPYVWKNSARQPGENSWIISPELKKLSGHSNLYLSLTGIVSLSFLDYCYVEISTDNGSSWNILAQYGTSVTYGSFYANIFSPISIPSQYATGSVYIRLRLIDNNDIYHTTNLIIKSITITDGMTNIGKISGTVKQSASNLPVQGVTITLNNSSSTIGTVVTDANGSYTISNVPPGNTYTLTPTLSGYSLSPSSVNPLNVTAGNTTTQDFTVNGGVFKGIITDAVTGVPLPGVIVTLSSKIKDTTDASGEYSVFVKPGSFTVTPSLAHYTFSPTPASTAISNGQTITKNFTSTLNAYNLNGSISGLKEKDSVKILLIDVLTKTEQSVWSSAALPDGSSTYDFGNIKVYGDINYSVNVAKYTGYTFSPSSALLYHSYGNRIVDFSATRDTYVISGQINGIVHTGNLTSEKVTVTCTNSSEGSLQVRGDGQLFQFHVPAFSPCTLTPTIEGFTFNYPSITQTNVVSDISNQNFDAIVNKYTISGIVIGEDGKGLSGIAMTIANTSGGTAPTSVITGLDGSYSYTVNSRQTYRITPTLAGKTIKPTYVDFVDVKESAVQNFFISSASLNTYTVTGYITRNLTGGTGLTGATVTVKKHGETAIWASTISDDNGKYTFTGVQGESYDITGAKSGYILTSSPIPLVTPALSADYSFPTVNNLVATPIRFNLNGKVTGLKNGAITTVSLQTKQGSNWVPVSSVTTDEAAGGNYIFNSAVEIDSNYRVMALATGFTLYPTDGREYLNPSTDISGADFTATPVVVTISGTVNGIRAAHLPVTLNCSLLSTTGGVVTPVTITTDALGNYSLSVEAYGRYRVTPVRKGYTFTGTFRDVDVNSISRTGIDFTSTLNTHLVTGSVTGFNNTHGSVTVAISPADEDGVVSRTITSSGSTYIFIQGK